MSTFLQLLRIAFWMLPLQRALTLIGGGVVVAGQLWRLPSNLPGSTLPVTFLGAALVLVVPLLAGGVFLRMLASSRALLLRPHARGRLLAGALGILVLCVVAWLLCYALAFLPVPPRFRPGAEQYLMMFALTLAFGTQCAVALFIASRSPAWTLAILVLWQLPGLLLHAAGAQDVARLLGGPVSLLASLVTWAVFGAWFLRARRIHGSTWRREAPDPVRSDAHAGMAPLTREQAMVRWVLANQTPLAIGAQCLAACLALLVIQWVFAHAAGTRPLQAMIFGALSLVTLLTGVLGAGMAARARTLLLAGGRTRLELFGWLERQLLRVCLAVGAAVAVAGAAAWFLVTPRPAPSAGYLAAAVLVPGACAAWLGLMQQHRRSLLDVLALLALAGGVFYAVVQPLYAGEAERWAVVGAEVALAVLLREVATVRWRGADWRRARHA